MRCVPPTLSPYVVREHHEQLGHLGVDKLTAELDRFYVWDIERPRLNKLIRLIVRHCLKCQMYKPASRDTKMKIRITPIPNRLGDSVAMDIFMMTSKCGRGTLTTILC